MEQGGGALDRERGSGWLLAPYRIEQGERAFNIDRGSMGFPLLDTLSILGKCTPGILLDTILSKGCLGCCGEAQEGGSLCSI